MGSDVHGKAVLGGGFCYAMSFICRYLEVRQPLFSGLAKNNSFFWFSGIWLCFLRTRRARSVSGE